MRILGILLICSSIAALGFTYTLTISYRVKALEELENFSYYFKSNIRFSMDDIYSLFLNFKAKYNIFLRVYTENFRDSINASLLNEIEKAAAYNFLNNLGKTDVYDQTEHCQYYSEVFSKLKSDAKTQLIEKGRLSKSLSLLCSAAVFILLI